MMLFVTKGGIAFVGFAAVACGGGLLAIRQRRAGRPYDAALTLAICGVAGLIGMAIMFALALHDLAGP